MKPVTSFNYLRVFRAVVNILENSRSMLLSRSVCDLAFFVMQGISEEGFQKAIYDALNRIKSRFYWNSLPAHSQL